MEKTVGSTLKMNCKHCVDETPQIVKEISIGGFLLQLSSIGEIKIASKYSDTTFVLDDNQTADFVQKINMLETLKKLLQQLA